MTQRARTKGKSPAPTPENTGAILTEGRVAEQSKAAHTENVALGVLRSSEPPLGNLTREERSWLAIAFDQLKRIYQRRKTRGPGKKAFCVFEVGNVYVQFLAPPDAEQLLH